MTRGHLVPTLHRVQPSQSQHSILEPFLRVDRQLDILGLHESPVRNVVRHPVVILRTGLLHAGSPVGLAIIRRLQSPTGIESSDKEEVVTERHHSEWIQPCDVSLGQAFSFGR